MPGIDHRSHIGTRVYTCSTRVACYIPVPGTRYRLYGINIAIAWTTYMVGIAGISGILARCTVDPVALASCDRPADLHQVPTIKFHFRDNKGI